MKSYLLKIIVGLILLALLPIIVIAQEPYDINDNNCVHYATNIFNAMEPSAGAINNDGFIIPDGLYVGLSNLKQANPDAEIGIGRMRPPTSTNCN